MKVIKGKFYYCNRMRVMNYLLQKGYNAIRTLPDIYEPKRCVWVYENTPELREALRDYEPITNKA